MSTLRRRRPGAGGAGAGAGNDGPAAQKEREDPTGDAARTPALPDATGAPPPQQQRPTAAAAERIEAREREIRRARAVGRAGAVRRAGPSAAAGMAGISPEQRAKRTALLRRLRDDPRRARVDTHHREGGENNGAEGGQEVEEEEEEDGDEAAECGEMDPADEEVLREWRASSRLRVRAFIALYNKEQQLAPDGSGDDEDEDAAVVRVLRRCGVELTDVFLWQQEYDLPLPVEAVEAHPELEACRGHEAPELVEAALDIEAQDAQLAEQLLVVSARELLRWRGLWGGDDDVDQREAAAGRVVATFGICAAVVILSLFLFVVRRLHVATSPAALNASSTEGEL